MKHYDWIFKVMWLVLANQGPMLQSILVNLPRKLFKTNVMLGRILNLQPRVGSTLLGW